MDRKRLAVKSALEGYTSHPVVKLASCEVTHAEYCTVPNAWRQLRHMRRFQDMYSKLVGLPDVPPHVAVLRWPCLCVDKLMRALPAL